MPRQATARSSTGATPVGTRRRVGTGAFGVTAVMLAQWILPTVGFALLIQDRGPVRGQAVVLLAPLLFTVGVFVASRMGPGLPPPADTTPPWLLSFLRGCVVVLGLLAVLHFSAVGIPLLSSSVETSRFDVGSSGLGGFPSRAVLYALPIAALIGLSTLSRGSRRPAMTLWIVFAVTQVFLGFKGGLIEVLIITALGLTIRLGRLGVKQLLGFAAGGVVAIAYVTYVGSKYQTLAGSDAGLAYVVRRSTSDAIIAGYTALTARPVGIAEDTSVLIRDVGVLFGRYLGTAPEGYSFDELVSSVVTGTPIQRGAFLVPVTVGGPVYLLYSMPVLVCVLVLIALGFAWHAAVVRLRRPSRPLATLGAGVAVYGIRVFLLNGNGAYLLINLTFTFVLLVICSAVGHVLFSRASAQRSGPLPEVVD
ncbi:hypothetical protein [Curtobacterium sp. MCBA15_009]|uniref:hypothetical protein n=1 Tax=Curtobacterium sp. MCBA15_009 TaxID=1898737 RepID=UPI0011137D09|nr:hypothetical protein [Curtobacterium sp. MCBA15_009]